MSRATDQRERFGKAGISEPDVERFSELVRQCGLRRTPHRLAILAQLTGRCGPLSVAEISQALSERGIDFSTVWRNLGRLVDAGLVRRILLPDNVYRFEMGVPGGPHAHFVCSVCHEVFCLRDCSPMGAFGDSPVGWVEDVVLSGKCETCLAARSQPTMSEEDG